ncbi:Endopolyphosphatase [Dinochytrium kinnereticum]|nr:Endopolyphosphatase [Dinochytrium kinnereticum]
MDPFYNPKSDAESRCHGKSLSNPRPIPAYYGMPSSGCDSPALLINETLKFIRDDLTFQTNGKRHKSRYGRTMKGVDELAFVLWTGDSSRHDRDDDMPKTEIEVFEQNAYVVGELLATFDPITTPIIPAIGNWDCFPAGDLPSVPNDTTFQKLWTLWSPFFPSSDPETSVAKETFLTGGFFTKTLVKDRLSAISINTLSFFESNSALEGDCAAFEVPHPRVNSLISDSIVQHVEERKRKGEMPHPGDVQIVWLEEQLLKARSQVKKVIVIGHVPPVTPEETLFLPNCLDWFTYLWGEFSDVIVFQYYGHINRDILHLLLARRIPGDKPDRDQVNPYHVHSLTPDTLEDLNLNEFTIASLSATSASIVPAFNPGFRTGSILVTNNSITMLDQSTFFADVEKASKRRERSQNSGPFLNYLASCSSKDDFGISALVGEDVERWILDLRTLSSQSSSPLGKKELERAVRKYAKCMAISLHEVKEETTGIDVRAFFWASLTGGAFVSFGMLIGGILRVPWSHLQSAKPERKPLLHFTP